MVSAMNHAKTLLKSLEILRKDAKIKFAELFTSSKSLSEQIFHCDLTVPRLSSRQFPSSPSWIHRSRQKKDMLLFKQSTLCLITCMISSQQHSGNRLACQLLEPKSYKLPHSQKRSGQNGQLYKSQQHHCLPQICGEIKTILQGFK
ncbi:hypothetical protein L9F63_021743, partial [Diploptera punctata]